MSLDWAAIRRAAVALTFVMLAGLLPAIAPAPAIAQTGDDVPREEREVTVTRGGQTFRVRPIRKVTTQGGRQAVAERLIVGFQPGVPPAEREAAHRVAASATGGRGRAVAVVGPDAHLVDVAGAASLERAAQVYAVDPRVAYAEPDFIVRATSTPNDVLFTQQWGLETIKAPLAWNVTQGAASRIVAVLDCGIYESGATFFGPGHPDINGKIVGRRDFTGSPYGADDFCNHGTHVAGIAAANTNNGVGVAGVGYATRLLNGKVLSDEGSGTTGWVASGIRWAADNGAHVINMSLGGPGACPKVVRDAITYAFARQVVVIAAAGNDGVSTLHSPASCPNTLAVASTDTTDNRSYFSNYGASWVDIAAPGSAILSTNFIGSYEVFNGTSMATPHVAGLAALVWATGHYTTAQAVIDRLNATADRIAGSGVFWQHGRINAYAAVAGYPTVVSVDGGHNALGAASPRQTWYFAEGYTQTGFDEYLTIMNPNVDPAPVTITYYLADGSTQTVNLIVGANARATVNVHDLAQGVGRGVAVAARVETTLVGGIVVERPIYFRYSTSVDGGHNTLGAPVTATVWYFAEGYTGAGFDEYLTIMNPSPTTAATVTITYYLEGGAPRSYSLTIAPSARATVAVHDVVQGVGRNQAVSAKVESTNATGIIVERPIYFTYSAAVNGGHNVLGATAPALAWYFAEGYTGTGFDEYLTILNPDATQSAAVLVTYYLSNGTVLTTTVNVGASRRYTIAVHDAVQGVGRNQAVSAKVESTNTVGIVVERPMYFSYTGSVAVNGGHNVMGATAPATDWYFAEGYTGTGFDEYLTIQNPNVTAGTATVTYYIQGQAVPETRTVLLAANSRTTIVVHDAVSAGNPGGLGRDKAHATRVTTTDLSGIIVERPIYFRYTMDTTP